MDINPQIEAVNLNEKMKLLKKNSQPPEKHVKIHWTTSWDRSINVNLINSITFTISVRNMNLFQ